MTMRRMSAVVLLALCAVFAVSRRSAANGSWSTVATFSGDATKDTATFTTHGGDLRFEVSVQPNSTGPVPLLIKMYPKGAPVDAHEVVREQCIDCKGPQTLDAGKVRAGTYFLHVTTSRPWTLKVEESASGK